MKKLIALLMVLLTVAALTACGPQTPDVDPATQPTTEKPVDDETGPADTEPAAQEYFSFTYEGVELIPSATFDPAQLPEADSVFEVPSCAIEGTDNVYSYPTFELTAYNDGTGEVIYSIYLLDADTPTAEGLYVGDDLARVTELYGTDYVENDTELTFTKGDTTLNLLLDGETVISIEYRMVV